MLRSCVPIEEMTILLYEKSENSTSNGFLINLFFLEQKNTKIFAIQESNQQTFLHCIQFSDNSHPTVERGFDEFFALKATKKISRPHNICLSTVGQLHT